MSKFVRGLQNRFKGVLVGTHQHQEFLEDGSIIYHQIPYNGAIVSVVAPRKNAKNKQVILANIKTVAELMEKMDHPNVLPLVAYHKELMVVEGGFTDTAENIHSLMEMATIAKKCLEALSYMHNGFTHDGTQYPCTRHGDVRSSNILLVRDAETIITRVVLGGLYKSRECENIEPTGRHGFISLHNTSTKADDVISLAITLLNSYFRRLHPNIIIVNGQTLPYTNALDQRAGDIVVKMLSANSHYLTWSQFMDDIIADWVAFINHPDIPKDYAVGDIHEDVIDGSTKREHVNQSGKPTPRQTRRPDVSIQKFTVRHDDGSRSSIGLPLGPPLQLAPVPAPVPAPEANNAPNPDDVFVGMDFDMDNQEKVSEKELDDLFKDITCDPTDKMFRYSPTDADGTCRDIGFMRGVYNPESKCCDVADEGGSARYVRALEYMTRNVEMINMMDVKKAIEWIRDSGKHLNGDILTIDMSTDSQWYHQLLDLVMGTGISTEEGKQVSVLELKEGNHVLRVANGLFQVYTGESEMINRMQKSTVNGGVWIHAKKDWNSFGISTVLEEPLRIIPCHNLTFSAPLENDTLFDISEIGRLINMDDVASRFAIFNNLIDIRVYIPCCFSDEMSREIFFASLFRGMKSHDPNTRIRLHFNLQSNLKSMTVMEGMQSFPHLEESDIQNIPAYARRGIDDDLIEDGSGVSQDGLYVIISDKTRRIRYMVNYGNTSKPYIAITRDPLD